MEVRLSKLMSEQGICSRREADQYIEMGLVKVNGEIISTLGTRVDPNAKIELVGKAQKKQENKVTIILNKPVGYVSTQPEKGYPAAIELINPLNQMKEKGCRQFHPSHLKKLSVVGRLDIDSKGLLILTQDGVLAKQVIGPDSQVEKEYLVRIKGDITEEKLDAIRFGMKLDDKELKAVQVDHLGDEVFRFVLTEGRNRQIRRMCEQVGLRVVSLKRVRIGNVLLGDLPLGKWCYLE